MYLLVFLIVVSLAIVWWLRRYGNKFGLIVPSRSWYALVAMFSVWFSLLFSITAGAVWMDFGNVETAYPITSYVDGFGKKYALNPRIFQYYSIRYQLPDGTEKAHTFYEDERVLVQQVANAHTYTLVYVQPMYTFKHNAPAFAHWFFVDFPTGIPFTILLVPDGKG